MKKILILMGRYLPGHKDGGPLRTIINVTDALGDEYDFYIGCLDRDHGDTEPYKGIKKNEWNQVGKAKVWYVEPGGFSNEMIMKLADGKDSIYLSSFYDDYGYKTLILKRKGKIRIPVALASMGVFSEGALAQKAIKKKLFIAACKAAGLFKNITWSVTSELEAEDLKRVIGKKAQYVIAEDFPRSVVPGRNEDHNNGPLRVVFLSRICAHKGLDIAIDAIKGMKHDCIFTIYGPIQEEEYWKECQEKLKDLSHWSYKGDVPSDDVQEVLSHQDVLILPTKSENYGHVVFEALSVGCIPVISKNTPWGSIVEKKAGYVTDNSSDQYSTILDSLDSNKILLMRENCIDLANERVLRSRTNTGYKKIWG